MEYSCVRDSGLNRLMCLLAIPLFTIFGVSVFLPAPLVRTAWAGSTTRGPVAIRLVDEFNPENVEETF